MLTVQVANSIAVVGGRLQVGSLLCDTYRIDRQLKGGRNAWVFAGEHRYYGPCVVKVLKGSGSGWRRRFTNGLSEVSRLAQAKSPWVATAFDAGSNGDIFYFSMAFIEGETLGELLKHKLTHRRRWALGQQYLAALLSTNDVVHADPHAGNVIVAPNWQDDIESPQLTLIDFGHGWPLVRRRVKEHRDKAVRGVMKKILRELPGYPRNLLNSGRYVSLKRYEKMLRALKPKDNEAE